MLAPNLLAQSDPELWNAIRLENQRQEDHVELIASENYVSRQVLEAQGSQLTNKYAEGYPGKRYYGGCEYVDIAEKLAIDRVKELFGAEYANVQPHSGSQANQAVYFAVLKPGDTILGMSHAHGALRGLDCGQALSHASGHCGFCLQHHAQNFARPARWIHPRRCRARKNT